MLGDYIGPGDSKYTEYDAAVTKRTCDWLSARADDDRPWCLYVGLVAPHFPLVVPQEYFDLYPLDSLPEVKLHPSSGYADTLADMETELRKLVDPEAADAQAFADQADMIARYGGRQKALKLGAPAATPPPKV